jgi:co-chaperonin GroES (HSP10)
VTFRDQTYNFNKRDGFVNDINVSTPKNLPVACHPRAVLVLPLALGSDSYEKTSGVILPDKVKDDLSLLTTVGKVIYISPEINRDEIRFSEGDIVVYDRFSGKKFSYNEFHDKTRKTYTTYHLLFLDFEEILLKINHPSEIDPVLSIIAPKKAQRNEWSNS